MIRCGVGYAVQARATSAFVVIACSSNGKFPRALLDPEKEERDETALRRAIRGIPSAFASRPVDLARGRAAWSARSPRPRPVASRAGRRYRCGLLAPLTMRARTPSKATRERGWNVTLLTGSTIRARLTTEWLRLSATLRQLPARVSHRNYCGACATVYGQFSKWGVDRFLVIGIRACDQGGRSRDAQ